MAAFNRKVNNCSKVDWEVLINGSISLYCDENILKKDLDWLKNNQYKVIILDFSEILSIEEFHVRIKKICKFPDYYGENMPALSDCLVHDLEIPYDGGCAFVFKDFDSFYAKDKEMRNSPRTSYPPQPQRPGPRTPGSGHRADRRNPRPSSAWR